MTATADKLAPQISRPFFDFTLPEGSREWETDPRTFSMQQPTTLQDIDSSTAASGDTGLKLLMERITRAIVIIDGKPADQGIPFLDNWSPQARDFAAIAFNAIVGLKPEHKTAFLASMQKRMPGEPLKPIASST